ncbi:MAG: hypothetical protein RLZZ50_1558 [Verrucomicrobiota bacterium]|jgi:signal transduction histidine kinase
MTLRRQLLATLFACIAIIVAMIVALHVGHNHEIKDLRENFAREGREQLENAVREESETLGLFVQDYSGWDEMVDFAAQPSPEWARLNIEQVMERFRLGAVWLAAPDGRIIFNIKAAGAEDLRPPPSIPDIVAAKDWQNEIGGFYRDGDTLLNLRARPVQPTADMQRLTKPVAWLIAVRRMDEDVLGRMGRRLRAEVSLRPTGSPQSVRRTDAVAVGLPLPAPFSKAGVAELHALFRIEALEVDKHYNQQEMAVLVLAVVLLMGVVGWSIRINVLRPLACIGESLETGEPARLAGVSPRLPEFARIADLVRDSLRQREALRHEIDERVRLGRDLHDGVIQNLYAAGMGIAHGVRLVPEDPGRAVSRLEETLRSLNDTMRVLRGYIARAEPEGAQEVDIADACVALFQTLRAHRECELDLQVAAEADAAIPAGQKANLLFIIREAVSNALRHGDARHVGVVLSRCERGWRLVVENDGASTDFSRPAGRGRGLDNIRARSRELGGEPGFSAKETGGVRVTVEWPCAMRTTLGAPSGNV